MTAASVLSLCMSLIARSPPDSSRSPTTSHHRQHRLTPAAGHQHRSACRDRELGRFRPHDHLRFATGALRGPRHGSARMHRRANTRGLRNAAAGMSPQRMRDQGCSFPRQAAAPAATVGGGRGECFPIRATSRPAIAVATEHASAVPPPDDRSATNVVVGLGRLPDVRFARSTGPLAPAGARMRFRADNAPAAPLKNSATAEHKITTSTRPAV